MLIFFIEYFCSICILFECLIILLFFLKKNVFYGFMILYMLWFVLDFIN
jgi:hypothetical protein